MVVSGDDGTRHGETKAWTMSGGEASVHILVWSAPPYFFVFGQ